MVEPIVFVAPSITAVIISIISLYYALKRTDYNEKSLEIQKRMLRESRKYWGSWAERAKDVSKRVLEQMTEDELERELVRKRIERERKKRKRQRAR